MRGQINKPPKNLGPHEKVRIPRCRCMGNKILEEVEDARLGAGADEHVVGNVVGHVADWWVGQKLVAAAKSLAACKESISHVEDTIVALQSGPSQSCEF